MPVFGWFLRIACTQVNQHIVETAVVQQWRRFPLCESASFYAHVYMKGVTSLCGVHTYFFLKNRLSIKYIVIVFNSSAIKYLRK